jgi:polysaccharide pyruvyl transferase WcaK-like protein
VATLNELLPGRVETFVSVASGPRIGILYPSGWGNLGDEAVLQATFEGLRQQWPRVVLRAFTLHPARTAANHGVETEPLTGLNRPLFCAPRDEGPLLVRAARAIARRTRSVPVLGKAIQWASDCTAEVVFESMALLRAKRWLATADLLLASGGGQLDDVWGGAWGQPYALARWAWLSRRAGVPFALLSVGYGGASTWLSRRLLRYAIHRAAYCSVRDVGSRELTALLGVQRDLPVVPDLAFALKSGSPLPARRPGYDIGISPMTYLRPGSWPHEDPEEYKRLIALWSDLVSARVVAGDRVHLFVSAPEDMAAVQDVWERLGESARDGCSIAETANPNDLLELYRRLDVVISSRLHGVLLAIVAGRPVLALSHERKVRAVMGDAGVSAFCAELSTATMDQVTGMLRELSDQLQPCERRLREYAGQARAALRQQEELLPQLLRHK